MANHRSRPIAPRQARTTATSPTAASSISPPVLARTIRRCAKPSPPARSTKLAEDGAQRSPDHALDAITWQPPIPAPEKIICIGVNYPDRNAEYKDGSDAPKYPSMFMRTPRSFVGHNTPLVRPRASTQLDYEGEVMLVIGKAGRHIKESEALGSHRRHHAVQRRHHPRLGAAREIQRHARQEFRFHRQPRPLARPLHQKSQIADIRLTTRVNGETRQDDRTSRLIFGFPISSTTSRPSRRSCRATSS